jgi:hypothetical protein
MWSLSSARLMRGSARPWPHAVDLGGAMAQRFHEDHLQEAIQRQRATRPVRRCLIVQETQQPAQSQCGHVGCADVHDRREQARNMIGVRLGEQKMARQETGGRRSGIAPLERGRIGEQRLHANRLNLRARSHDPLRRASHHHEIAGLQRQPNLAPFERACPFNHLPEHHRVHGGKLNGPRRLHRNHAPAQLAWPKQADNL